MNFKLTIFKKFLQAYTTVCKPLCRELGLSQSAFDILMFLGNNPTYKTASEIVEIRHIKANLVSLNVERLVREGYLKRQPMQDDRRKTELLCTQKAQPIIARGQQLQNGFFEQLFAGMDTDQRKAFSEALGTIEKNVDKILEVDK